MRNPTDEQRAVLKNDARVRVVRASPGSGKTWLVAELIRRELEKWPTNTSGIAALSFTRVGGDEIRKAVGYELDHPHFVGTLDAFLFRYVVRPFLQKCFPSFAPPCLIPGEWGANHWVNYGRNQKANIGKKGINLFGCVFVGEKNGGPVVAYKPHPAQPLRELVGYELTQFGNAKSQLWECSGCLTHSDAALWASKILEHTKLGKTVREELVKKFPLIIVDELQDTGYFLGKSIRLLVSEPAARCVLVGDPDQAIYEFNGARPDLFNCFESIAGATTLRLDVSRRCARAIVAASKHVKDSCGVISPAVDRRGRTFLVRYTDMQADVRRMLAAIPLNGTVKVIARSKQTVETLIRRSAKDAPKLGCPTLNHMQRAVVAFLQGRQVAALAAARAALESVIFQHEGVDDAELEKHDIEPARWKRLAVECLLRASAVAASGNLYDWQTAVGKILDEKLDEFGLGPSLQFTVGRLKPKRINDWDKTCAEFIPQVSNSATLYADVPVTTVHGVKGETHDITIFVCPDTSAAHCPSAIWWPQDEKDREERRIAYVAMTRTQGDLILCVSENCYGRLCESRKPFVDSFECMTVDEFVAMTGKSVG